MRNNDFLSLYSNFGEQRPINFGIASYRHYQMKLDVPEIVSSIIKDYNIDMKNLDNFVMIAPSRELVSKLNCEIRKTLGFKKDFELRDRIIFTKNNDRNYIDDVKYPYYNGLCGEICKI
jgi:hypothetical protein